ncbi:hypothetical protein [Metabacillus sp. RGM 3146]|uniref:hypothetical protein n=1 Tax=Metabacillus sp. RGM 3146 TaxID=3401092 RepID=UPI003B9C13C1
MDQKGYLAGIKSRKVRRYAYAKTPITPIFKREEKEQRPQYGDTVSYNGKDYTILNEEPNGVFKLIHFHHSAYSIVYYKKRSWLNSSGE